MEIADLMQERFDPVLAVADEPNWDDPRKQYSDDVMQEMARVERNDSAILLFPVYWWSMPALMKGWIDRVWNHGWAYGDRELPLNKCWILAIAGNSHEAFSKRGYDIAIQTQLEMGILDYCGIKQRRLEVLYGSIEGEQHVERILRAADRIGAEFVLT